MQGNPALDRLSRGQGLMFFVFFSIFLSDLVTTAVDREPIIPIAMQLLVTAALHLNKNEGAMHASSNTEGKHGNASHTFASLASAPARSMSDPIVLTTVLLSSF